MKMALPKKISWDHSTGTHVVLVKVVIEISTTLPVLYGNVIKHAHFSPNIRNISS
jgi:hypothetical protein